jgi:4-hydroxy-tetrahydrodipicolinate reductase
MAAEGIRVVVAGATGWLGSAIAERVHGTAGLCLVAAVGRSRAGQEFPRHCPGAVPLAASVEAALEAPADVFVDATEPAAAVRHARAAMERGLAAIVVATEHSLSPEYRRLGMAARRHGVAFAVIPNLAITLAALELCVGVLAGHFPRARIADHATAGVREPTNTTLAIADVVRSGGAEVTISCVRTRTQRSQVRLCLPLAHDELEIRHTARDVRAYADGAITAIRGIGGRTGLLSGLSWVFERGFRTGMMP